MEESVVSLELTTRGMMAALAVGGLWPRLASPLTLSLPEALWEVEDEAWQPSLADLHSLEEQGLLSQGAPPKLMEGFRKALQTLVDPRVKIVTCFGTADTVGVACYFSWGVGDGLVLYQSQDMGIHLLSSTPLSACWRSLISTLALPHPQVSQRLPSRQVSRSMSSCWASSTPSEPATSRPCSVASPRRSGSSPLKR